MNTGRVIVADSWFGSVKSCVALLERGLYSVLNVKTSHKYFPRDDLLKHLEVREDCYCVTATAKVNGEDVKIIAIGHMDKKPLLLVRCVSRTLLQ